MGIYKRNDQDAAISDKPHHKYPWEAAIFVRIYHTCQTGGGILKSHDQNWNEVARRQEQEASNQNTERYAHTQEGRCNSCSFDDL